MRKLAKLFILCVSLIGFGLWGGNANAATCTSTAAGGNWNAAGTWTGCGGNTPGSADNAIIATTGTGAVSVNLQASVVALTINAGSFLNIASGQDYRIRTTGATSISGTLNFGTSSSSSRFGGLVTVTGTGTWNNAGNQAVNFRGGITNNGTFTGGTGTQTFDTNSQAIGGASPINLSGVVAVVGAVTITNNNTNVVTIAGNLTGNNASSTWVNNTNSTLNYGGATGPMGTRVFTASASGNTVNYIGAVQAVDATTYYNLTLSGSGTKTMPATATVTHDFIISSGVAVTAGAALTVGGNWTELGSFAQGTGTVTLNGASAQSISGTVAFNNLTLTNAANPNITLATNVTVGATLTQTQTVKLTSTCPTDYTLTAGATVFHSCPTVSATNSTVVANPTSVLADNSTTSTITVTLKDAAGTAIPGKTVTLAAGSGSSVISAASGVSDGSGVVTFTVKDAIIEGPITYTATDTTDLIVITQTAQVTFTDPLCFSDDFNRASLLSLPNWSRTSSGTNPFNAEIVSNRLRLTDTITNEATAVHLSRLFPGFGNKVVAEFNYFAYNGSGADGMAITLSDASISPLAGAYGGSLGYAQKTGIPGFAGGWIGIGLDEYGNYSNPTEGRVDGFCVPPALCPLADSISIRGSGSNQSGYNYHTRAAAPGGVDQPGATPGPGDRYKITVDHSDSLHAWVTVDRDNTTRDGTAYVNIIPRYDAKAISTQAAVPTNWYFSFTSSTGASTNIHEIDNLRVCTAQPPVIPVLDHVRIIHDGSALTCVAKTITLKACANAACSALYTGNVTVDLATISGATWSTDPITFSGGQVEVTLAKATNGTVTLGGNVTAPSSMAAVCYNGSTSGDCLLTYSSSACAFDAVEPGQAPGTPIFTKLAGTAFTVDVLALNAGVINTGFTSQVTVGLVDQTGVAEGTCGSTVLASPTTPTSPYTFTSGNAGRRTFTFNYANAARDVRVRIVRVSSGLTACSSDNFAIRPTSFSVISPDATNAGTTGTPTFKAGTDAFELDATSVNGYTGTALINSTRLEAHSGAVQTGTLNGSFSPATAVSSWVSKGTAFTYSEVGNFRFKPWGVYDDGSFADVDRSKPTPECFIDNKIGTNLDPADPNAKDGNGKYGCYFGGTNTTGGTITSPYFGRFIPDHFDTVVTGPMVCPSGLTCPADGLVYSGQPFNVQVTAKNASGNPTQNYQGAFAKEVTLSAVTASGGAAIPTAAPGGTLSPNSAAASSFAGGSNAATLAKPVFTFATTPTTPTDVFVRAIDADSVSSLLPSASSSVEGGVKVVSGRIKIPNVYGSELLPLPMTATVQYWNGTSWLTSLTDSVTSFALGAISKSIVKGPLAVGDMVGAVVGDACSSTVFCTGVKKIVFTNAAKATGSADVSLSAPNYLLAGSNGAGVNPSTAGRATFGIYKSPLIYRRENY